MSWFNNLNNAARLMLAFGVALLLTLSLGGYALWSMARMERASGALSENWLPSVEAAMQMRIELGEARRWELAHLLSAEPAQMADYEARDARTLAAFAADQARYATLVSSPAEAELFRAMSGLAAQFLEEHRYILALSRAMKKEEGHAETLAQSAALMTQLSARVDALVALNVKGGSQAGADARRMHVEARWWTCLLLVDSTILCICICAALALARKVAPPMVRAMATASMQPPPQCASGVVATCRSTARAPRRRAAAAPADIV